VKQCSYLVESRVWNLSEVHDQQMDMHGQPQRSKHDDHENKSSTCLSLLVDASAALTRSNRVTAAGRERRRRRQRRLVTRDVAQNADRKDNDHGQWDKVGEREEGGVELLGGEVAVDRAARDATQRVRFGAVLDEYRSVDGQHQGPDSDDHRHHPTGSAIPRGAGRVNDGHVANDGD